MSVSKKFFGLMAAALMVGVVAGCGGGGNNPVVVEDNVTVNGGIATSPGSSAESIPAGENRTVSLTVNGNTKNVVIAPSTSAIPAGTQLAVFPANVPIIQNLTRGTAVTRAPGQIIINGTLIEGVTVTDQGRLSEDIAFGPGRYVMQIDGPWNITSGGRTLTVGQFVVEMDVNTTGVTSFPTNITGKLPSNGGSTRDEESFVTFTVDEAFANSTARLTIEKSNGDISKRISFPGNSGTFSDLFPGGGNATIPAGGVETVYFEYNPAN